MLYYKFHLMAEYWGDLTTTWPWTEWKMTVTMSIVYTFIGSEQFG